MPEDDVATETLESEGESWLDEHDLSDEDRETHSKYKSLAESLKGSAHAIRQVGKSVRWPDDKTSEEDRAKFNEKLHAFQGVPKTPEEYKIDRSGIPEGADYDEEMETNFRQWAHESKAPQSVVTKMFESYNKVMLERHQAMETVAKEAEAAYRKELGKEADVKLGNPDDEESIGTIKEGLLQLSAKLKLDYKDKEGNLRSHLIDDLELNRKGGQIGDKISLVKALDHLLNIAFGEGTTHLGEAVNKGKGGKGEAFSDEFYDNPEPGGEN